MSTYSKVIDRLNHEGFIEGNVALVDELFAEDYVDHDPLPGMSGREGVRQLIQLAYTAFSDQKIGMSEHYEAGDVVTENWVMHGQHTGEFLGVPATGRAVTARGIDIWRFRDGKIVERWGVFDLAGLMEQLTG